VTKETEVVALETQKLAVSRSTELLGCENLQEKIYLQTSVTRLSSKGILLSQSPHSLWQPVLEHGEYCTKEVPVSINRL
jgi:hypothetical protein